MRSLCVTVGRSERRTMKIALTLLRWLMNFIYFFLKLFPTDDGKVLFLSRQSNTVTEDFALLADELRSRRPDVKIVMITKRADKGLGNMLGYAGATLRSMYHLATSRVCVLDSYWPAVSVLRHKKKLAVVQLWHAMGKIKKSGYQSVGKKFGRSDTLAREMRMHRNYDVVIAGGRAFNPFYCASFGVEPDILYNVGLPRMDSLREGISEARRRFYGAYPQLAGKKIVLYAPTFRKGHTLSVEALVKAFDFNGEQVLVVKRHPNQLLDYSTLPPALSCPRVSTSTVLSVCDCVITDYSAITIEAAVLGKPVYFYLFDYEAYLEHNGLNVSLPDELPSCVFREPRPLLEAIERGDYDWEAYRAFREKYLPDQSGRATDKIALLICGCMERDKHDVISESIARQNQAGGAVGGKDTVCAQSL